jgi:hypothetical protein
MKKKSLEYKTTQISLNRSQIEKLAKMSNHFQEVEWFTLEETHESGIGPTVRVKFNLFDKNDTVVDVTDVSTW